MIGSVRLAELLSARICHDLVNPVGACNNGLEMLADASSDIFDEAVELAQDSGRSAARILQYFRLAYGTAAERAGPGGIDIKQAVEDFFSEASVELTWSDETYNDPMSAGMTKLLLNLLLVADESLPRGGSLSVQLAATGSGHEIAILAMGEGARLRAETSEALTEDLHESALTTRNIQGAFSRLLAQGINAELQLDESQPNCVVFSVAS
jgi:histidine phosphotransferase ChpT